MDRRERRQSGCARLPGNGLALRAGEGISVS